MPGEEWQALTLQLARQALGGEAQRTFICWSPNGSRLFLPSMAASRLAIFDLVYAPLSCAQSLERALGVESGLFLKDRVRLEEWRELILAGREAIAGASQRLKDWLAARIRPQDPQLWKICLGHFADTPSLLTAVGLERLLVMASLRGTQSVPSLYADSLRSLSTIQLELLAPPASIHERFVLSLLAGKIRLVEFTDHGISWEAALSALLSHSTLNLSDALAAIVLPPEGESKNRVVASAELGLSILRHLCTGQADPLYRALFRDRTWSDDWSLPFMILHLFDLTPSLPHPAARNLQAQLLAHGHWHLAMGQSPYHHFDPTPFILVDQDFASDHVRQLHDSRMAAAAKIADLKVLWRALACRYESLLHHYPAMDLLIQAEDYLGAQRIAHALLVALLIRHQPVSRLLELLGRIPPDQLHGLCQLAVGLQHPSLLSNALLGALRPTTLEERVVYQDLAVQALGTSSKLSLDAAAHLIAADMRYNLISPNYS